MKKLENIAPIILTGAASILGFSKADSFTGISFYKNGKRISDHGQTEKWSEIYGESETILLIGRHFTKERAEIALSKLGLTFEQCLIEGEKIEQEEWEAQMMRNEYLSNPFVI